MEAKTIDACRKQLRANRTISIAEGMCSKLEQVIIINIFSDDEETDLQVNRRVFKIQSVIGTIDKTTTALMLGLN